jgi:glycosyltransferase involved in cell wall biosynthesis
MLTDSALREDYLPSVPPNRTGQSRIRVLWASKLLRWKGVDLALRAMQQLGEQSGVHLVIAGGGPLTGELEATIKTLGLQHSVTAKGPVPWRDMPDEFSSADVFLFTSVRDSFGSVILEAAAHRLPIIHLNLGGAGAALPSDAGIKIQPSTVKATAESIAKALAYMRDHPDARARMGQAAYDFAKANLWPRHASIMQEIYRECAASGGQR